MAVVLHYCMQRMDLDRRAIMIQPKTTLTQTQIRPRAIIYLYPYDDREISSRVSSKHHTQEYRTQIIDSTYLQIEIHSHNLKTVH